MLPKTYTSNKLTFSEQLILNLFSKYTKFYTFIIFKFTKPSFSLTNRDKMIINSTITWLTTSDGLEFLVEYKKILHKEKFEINKLRNSTDYDYYLFLQKQDWI